MRNILGMRLRIMTFFTLIALVLVTPVLAQPVEILAEGTYQMGDNDTPALAEDRALLKAKRNALEQAGTYITSYTSVKNYQVSDDLLVAFSTGVIKVTILDTQRTQSGNGMEVRVKIKAVVDTAKLDEFIKNINTTPKSNAATATITKSAPAEGQLQYNGLYRAVTYHGHYSYYYYRFFPDGTVTSYFSPFKDRVDEVYRALELAPEGKGEYAVQNGKITFSLHFPKGNVVYKGIMVGDSLRLTFHSYIIDTDGGYDCKFVEINPMTNQF